MVDVAAANGMNEVDFVLGEVLEGWCRRPVHHGVHQLGSPWGSS